MKNVIFKYSYIQNFKTWKFTINTRTNLTFVISTTKLGIYEVFCINNSLFQHVIFRVKFKTGSPMVKLRKMTVLKVLIRVNTPSEQ